MTYRTEERRLQLIISSATKLNQPIWAVRLGCTILPPNYFRHPISDRLVCRDKGRYAK